MQKACTRCGQEKPLDEFRFNAVTGKHSYVCTVCWKPVRQIAHIHSTMENYLRQKVRQQLVRKGTTLRRAQMGSSITIDEVMAIYEKQGGRCAVTGEELTHAQHTLHTNASIDRIDSDRGYEPDNVRLVCSIVNIMRMRLSDEELGIWSLRIAKGLGFCK